MILIADSGSTKTTWAEVESGLRMVTEGLNPHFTTDDQFLDACASVRKQLRIQDTDCEIFFYGAGCGHETQRDRLSALLHNAFGTSSITVETDLLGACRAAAGNEASLVGILGTGSNACYYDGNSIVYRIPSLGYLIGDEGSANHVGRMLLKDYLSGDMPDNIEASFHAIYPFSYAEWIERLYHQPQANRFLASLAPFATSNITDNYCNRVVTQSIEAWYANQVQNLRKRCNHNRISIIGGWAKAAEKTLRAILEEEGVMIEKVMAEPMDGLVAFHKSDEPKG